MASKSMETDGRLSRGQQTQERLIEAALHLFAEKGFAGVGIREVAAAADTNIASIAFHFANKDGLYKAVIEHVADAMAKMHRKAIDAARQTTNKEDTTDALLVRLVENLIISSLTSNRSQWMSLLLQREFIDPTEHFATIYDRALQPILELFMELLGSPEPAQQDRLREQALSFMLFIITSAYMRNRNTFLHFSGKADYDPDSIRRIAGIVADFVANGLFSTNQ